LKNKSNILNKEFQTFYTKVFIRLTVMFFMAVLLIYFLRFTVLRGSFADFIIDNSKGEECLKDQINKLSLFLNNL